MNPMVFIHKIPLSPLCLDTLNSLPNDILELQTLLRSLLKNIIVNNYKEDLIRELVYQFPELYSEKVDVFKDASLYHKAHTFDL